MKNTIKAIKKAFIVVLIAQLAVIAISCKGGSGNGKVSKEKILDVIEETMKYQEMEGPAFKYAYKYTCVGARKYAETAKYSLEKEISKEQMREMFDELNMNLSELEKDYNELDEARKRKVRPDLFENNEN